GDDDVDAHPGARTSAIQSSRIHIVAEMRVVLFMDIRPLMCHRPTHLRQCDYSSCRPAGRAPPADSIASISTRSKGLGSTNNTDTGITHAFDAICHIFFQAIWTPPACTKSTAFLVRLPFAGRFTRWAPRVHVCLAAGFCAS